MDLYSTHVAVNFQVRNVAESLKLIAIQIPFQSHKKFERNNKHDLYQRHGKLTQEIM